MKTIDNIKRKYFLLDSDLQEQFQINKRKIAKELYKKYKVEIDVLGIKSAGYIVLIINDKPGIYCLSTSTLFVEYEREKNV